MNVINLDNELYRIKCADGLKGYSPWVLDAMERDARKQGGEFEEFTLDIIDRERLRQTICQIHARRKSA